MFRFRPPVPAAPSDSAPDELEAADDAAGTDNTAGTGEAEATDNAAGTDDAEATDEAPPVDEHAQVEETPTATRKPAGRYLKAALAAAATVFVAAGAFAGAMLQPYLADRALVDTKLEIARTATSAITTLWTYTPENMDSLPDRSAKYLAADFEDQYRKYIDAIAPVNKQAKVSNSTEVVGTAVESLSGKDATAVVYTNTTNSTPQSQNIPSLQYLSYRLIMQHEGSRWLITKMTTITSLDLTPRLG